MIGGNNDPYLVDNRAMFKNVQCARQYLSPAKLQKWLGNVTTHSDAAAGSGNQCCNTLLGKNRLRIHRVSKSPTRATCRSQGPPHVGGKNFFARGILKF